MRIIIKIDEREKEIKRAMARGRNYRFNDQSKASDITEVLNKEDILSAITYLDWDKIEVEVEEGF